MIAVSIFLRSLRYSVPAAIGWLLGRQFAPGMALALCAALAVLVPTAGALLLRTLKVGQVDWRNYLSGWLLPFGYTLGRGKLLGIALACIPIWFGVAASGVMLAQPAVAAPTTAPQATAATPTWAWPALIAGWVVLGTAFVHLLGVLTKNFTVSSSSGRHLLKVMAVALGLIAVSAALHAYGYTGTAALVACGPPLAIGTLFGLWVLVLVTFGRNARWN